MERHPGKHDSDGLEIKAKTQHHWQRKSRLLSSLEPPWGATKKKRHRLMPSEPDHICKPCMKHFGNTKTGIWRFEHSKGWFLVNLTGPSPGYKWVNQPRSIDVTVSRLRTFARRSPCRVSSCARLPIWDTQQFRKMLFSKQTYKYIHDYIWL